MGTFAGYFGSLHIPEERRPEFAERMRKLFIQGGTMTLEPVKIMGIAIYLMTPPFYSENRRFFVDYNYFEDDWWEGTGFNAEDDPAENTIWSQKIGERQYNWVTTAAYVLSEFYSDSFMVTEMDGRVINAVEYIGWLNYLFNETYTNARIKNLWNIYKLLPDFARHHKLERLLRDEDLKSLSYIGFLTYMVIAHPEEFQPDDTALDAATTTMSLADAILSWLDNEFAGIKWSKAFLQNLKETSEDPAAELVRLKGLMTLPTVKDIVFPNENERRFAIYTKFLPYEVVLFLLAEAFEVDFWSLLEELEPHIPKARHDWYERSAAPFPVIAPVKTSQFLECTDDDRAYWWTPSGDVTFSDEMEQWMSGLNEEMKEILATEGTLIAPGDFFMTFLKTLEDANTSYRRVYAFSSMFQEFIGNGARREFQAAVILLQRLLKRYEAEIQALQNARWPSEWNLPGRRNIKRYLAILANTELRQHVLGF